MEPEAKTISSRPVVVAMLVWLAAAVAVGASGVQARWPMPLPQLVLLSLTGIVLLLFWKLAWFRQWALTVDLRCLVAFHLTRFVGFYFLHLHSRGELPYDFAVPGGTGDIAVAVTALVVMASPSNRESILKIYGLWNTLGLVDILFVVFTAARLGLANAASMKALTHLPLSLLITFVVPIIIATHIVIFVRLRQMKRRPSPNV